MANILINHHSASFEAQDAVYHSLTPMADGSETINFDMPQTVPEGAAAVGTKPLRLRFKTETEVRPNGTTRALFKVSVKQEIGDDDSCCCQKNRAPEDDEYTVHLVAVIPPRVAKAIKRQVINGIPYPLMVAADLLRSYMGYNTVSGKDVICTTTYAAAGGSVIPALSKLAPVPLDLE